jgi:hypothetical protein
MSRKEKGEERVGVGGRGKYPGALPHIKEKKEREKQADQYCERGKSMKKKLK